MLQTGYATTRLNFLPRVLGKSLPILPLAGKRHKSNTTRDNKKTRPLPTEPRPAKPQGKSHRPPRPDELIKARSCLREFFSQFNDFKYDPVKPYMDEFHRLVRLKKWSRKGEEYKKARKEIDDAGVQQFNRSIGTEVDDLAAWHRIFRLIKGEGLPKTIEECQIRARLVLQVNICDLLDARATGKKARNFEDLDQLRNYTRIEKKYFPRENVSAGAILEFLLRYIRP
ncbi:hypothetical protein FS749_005835 [Ceratobasidium sp. UAMH 11750]|nr:hypothetical protein FS749_005835 [Ceratobasidium sp. UAMH 11750]